MIRVLIADDEPLALIPQAQIVLRLCYILYGVVDDRGPGTVYERISCIISVYVRLSKEIAGLQSQLAIRVPKIASLHRTDAGEHDPPHQVALRAEEEDQDRRQDDHAGRHQ